MLNYRFITSRLHSELPDYRYDHRNSVRGCNTLDAPTLPIPNLRGIQRRAWRPLPLRLPLDRGARMRHVISVRAIRDAYRTHDTLHGLRRQAV